MIISEVTSSRVVSVGSGRGSGIIGSGIGSGDDEASSIMYSSTLTYLSLHSSETGSHSCTSTVQVDQYIMEIAQPETYDIADFNIEAGKFFF